MAATINRSSPWSGSPKKKSPRPINIGARVEIINPIVVDRVGYPLTPAMVYKELNTAENRQRVIDMLKDFDVPVGESHFNVFDGTIPPQEVEGVLKVISYYTVQVRHFGGSERKLYTTEYPELKGRTFMVEEKKVVRTGVRVPARGGGEDYESAYLEKPKTHILLKIWGCPNPSQSVNVSDYMWIESTNVKVV